MSLYLNKKPCRHCKADALLGKHNLFIVHNLKCTCCALSTLLKHTFECHCFQPSVPECFTKPAMQWSHLLTPICTKNQSPASETIADHGL